MMANDGWIELSVDERGLMNHITRWGSDGYPVRKLCSKWTWGPFRSIKGSPVMYPTKTKAVAAFEAYMDSLRERYAHERYLAAVIEQEQR